MKKSTIWKKLLMVLGALVAVVGIVVASVLGTIAYLSDSALIQNSFTIGKVGLVLDEAAVTEMGVPIDSATRTNQNTYKLVANHSYTKDPTIKTTVYSQPSFIFIIIRNDLTQTTFEDKGDYGEVTIAEKAPGVANTIEANDKANGKPAILDQVLANGWIPYTRVATGNVYVYGGIVTTGEGESAVTSIASAASEVGANATLPIFQKLHIAEGVTEDDLHRYLTAQINVRAFAIQNTGFTDDAPDAVNRKTAVDKAWDALVTEYSNVIVPAGN